MFIATRRKAGLAGLVLLAVFVVLMLWSAYDLAQRARKLRRNR